ncbi:MAG: trypsin-like peptidase domain-containing protein [Lachnospiraceae bacterium]|nr:trypsin-like peptidase domain-containing protein [Candidatus Equihabitans merdae]
MSDFNMDEMSTQKTDYSPEDEARAAAYNKEKIAEEAAVEEEKAVEAAEAEVIREDETAASVEAEVAEEKTETPVSDTMAGVASSEDESGHQQEAFSQRQSTGPATDAPKSENRKNLQRDEAPHWARGEMPAGGQKKKTSGKNVAAAIVAVVLVISLVAGAGFAAVYGLTRAVSTGVVEDIIEEGGLNDIIDGVEEFKDPAGLSELPGEQFDVQNRQAVELPENGEELSIEQVASLCMPSMVAITCTSVEEVQSYFYFGEPTQRESTSAGTGVIIDESDDAYYIVTNNHVIDGAQNVSVSFVDDSTCEAEYVGRDTAEDLALISVNKSDLSDETRAAIRVISIGSKDGIAVGSSVVAIGNALGYGQSVSAGIVSAIGRQVVVDGVAHTLIQTDAAINPGNSGGALINRRGELIGINEVKYAQTQVEGMGYAIPVDTMVAFVDKELNRETREKVSDDEAAYLGVMIVTMQDAYVQQGYPSGVIVTEVTADGPAEAAGMQANDIITAIDGISVTTSDELIEKLSYYRAGEVISFTVLRFDENANAKGFTPMSISVELGSKAAMQESQQEEEPTENILPEGDFFSRR